MIERHIDIDSYWEVVVFFDIDYDLFWIIGDKLSRSGCRPVEIDNIYRAMRSNAKAFTYSNTDICISVIGFNRAWNRYELINSMIHEAEHVKQAALRSYKVDDEGEPPAYTVGYIASEMIKAYDKILKPKRQ